MADSTDVDIATERELADGVEHTGATKREGHGSVRVLPRGSTDAIEHFRRGTLLGRYVVIDVLGEGGMGVVYTAYDPELDRKVAVKLLQAGTDGSGGKAWLLREAQALARLSHPNVIAVHDVGVLPGDRVFVAMELVEGVTLRKWLDTPHGWRETLDVMRDAGAGLAAAHAAGLVHRDFKPENVLVGEDGRVRVLDFGLARLSSDRDGAPVERSSDREIEVKSPLSEQLTIAGTVVGTPVYMAPELHAGGGANPATDQFSFGVTLYEALFRLRPYSKDALRAADSALRPRTPPSDVRVPVAIQRALMRAISIDPGERYSSMTDLIEELARDPLARRKKLAAGAGGVAVLGGAIAAVFALSSRGNHASAPEPCVGIEARLAGAWDPAIAKQIESAFAATKHPRAAKSFAAVKVALDRYASDWSEMATESCRATRVSGEQTEHDMTLRQDCLDTARDELHAFTSLLKDPDAALIDKAEPAAYKLDPIARCADLPMLRAPDRPPPEIRPRLAEAQAKIAAGKAAVIAGRFGAAINRGKQATALVRELDYDPALAASQTLVGSALIQVGNFADGVEALTEGARAAIRGRQDDLATQAALWAALAYATGLDKQELAIAWFGIGSSTAARVHDRMLEVKLLETEGVVRGKSGDLRAAVAAHEKALALAIELLGKDNVVIAQEESNLAVSLTKVGAYAKAKPHYEHAVEIVERTLGEHPDLAPVLTGLALCHVHSGEVAKARGLYERALSIQESHFGPNSPLLIITLNNFADMLLRSKGQGALAKQYVDRALAIATRTIGRGHPMYHTIATTAGEAMAAMGHTGDAEKQFDTVIALEDKVHSPVLGVTLTARARIAVDENQWDAAVELAQRGVEALEATGGNNAPNLWPTLVVLAKAQIGAGHPDLAKPALERAHQIATSAQVTDAELAEVRALQSSLQ